jgi:hypothetical protein
VTSGAMQRPVVRGNMLRTERIRRADPCARECLCDQLAESLGLPKLDETAERPVTVGRGGVDQNTCPTVRGISWATICAPAPAD